MKKIKISAVSYLNTTPFIYGIESSGWINDVELSLDIPAVCAQKLLANEVDLGLIPVAVIPQMKEHYIVSDFCIGADGDVDSVKLFSEVPLNEIEKIVLDYQSRTSAALVKILASKHWNIHPKFEDAKKEFEKNIAGKNAAVVIGDRALKMNGKFKHEFDLAGEWKKLTKMPFVFACWVSNKKLSDDFLQKFNAAMGKGVNEIPSLIRKMKSEKKYDVNIEDYLQNKISYPLDERKKIAMKMFLATLKD